MPKSDSYTKEALVSKLKELDDAYKASQKFVSIAEQTPELPNIQKLNLSTLMTEEQLKQTAKDSLEADYTAGKQKLINTADNAKDKLQIDKSTVKSKLDSESKAVDEGYDNKARITRSEAINRGVARSSILTEAISVLGEEKAGEIESLTNAYNAKIAMYDAEIALVDENLNKSLASFDITHAVELQDRINDLTRDRDKEELAMIKYNNSVEKEIVNYRLSRGKAIADEREAAIKEAREKEKFEAENGMYGEKLKSYQDRLAVAKETLKGVSRAEALEWLNNSPEIRTYLGEDNYKTLKAQVLSSLWW